jgi:hypothetical protein
MCLSKTTLIFFSLFIFCTIELSANAKDEQYPKTIKREDTIIGNFDAQRTIIKLDGNTTREEVIETCSFLASENVLLTFDKLVIGRSFLGVIGKKRIRKVAGQISFLTGLSQNFKAGGLTGFKYLKIQYTTTRKQGYTQIEMIEKK